MWPLDANMDIHLTDVLNELGVACDTAEQKGWKALSNGQLVTAAVSNSFECLLTRDRLFGEAAARALQLNPAFAVVLVNLPQRRWPEYRQSFLAAWASSPIRPKPGFFIEWPS